MYKTLYWKWRNHDTISSYWKERNHKSNEYLINILSDIPFDSLLEIGCNCGNRLFNVSKVNKNSKIVGIDVNIYAVRQGNLWLNQEGISNVILKKGNINDLSSFKDNSFQVVFSWATLIYIRPKQIVKVLKELIRIASKRIILIEMHGSGCRKGVWCQPGNWKRDYINLFMKLGIDIKSIRLEHISQEIWDPGGGGACSIQINI